MTFVGFLGNLLMIASMLDTVDGAIVSSCRLQVVHRSKDIRKGEITKNEQ
jgi:hypothetical protein